jgi:ABC-type transport system substrate-binding protein
VVAANSALQVDKTPSIVLRYVSLNTLKKPFTDMRVRQALNYAIDNAGRHADTGAPQIHRATGRLAL